ncbi:MAG: hypothetical protein M3442_11230 [Chloroflexota bacterium]|nr:hypothetical protein [Chloroflexota bacterium]
MTVQGRASTRQSNLALVYDQDVPLGNRGALARSTMLHFLGLLGDDGRRCEMLEGRLSDDLLGAR